MGLLGNLLNEGKKYVRDAMPGGLLNPEVPKDMPTEVAKGILGLAPVVGDAISGYDAYQAARQGNYGEAALNGIGLLPFVPAFGGMVGKGGKIVDADAKLAEVAVKDFGKTQDIKEAGYILPDGTMLDFSGRHEAARSDWPYLRGTRNTDHRQLTDSVHNLLPTSGGGTEGMRQFMNQANAVRNQPGIGFDTTFVPSESQLMQIMRGWRGNRDSMYVDATHPETFDVIKSFEVERPTVEKLKGLLSDAFSSYVPKAEKSVDATKPLGDKAHILRFADTEAEANAMLDAVKKEYGDKGFGRFAVSPSNGGRFAIWGGS